MTTSLRENAAATDESPIKPVAKAADASEGTDGSLSKMQAKSLYRSASKTIVVQQHGHEESHGHGHHFKPHSILTAFASSIINFLLMFGLCCAYGMIMFEDDWNSKHRGLAVKMNLCSALVVGLLLSALSKVPVAIGGPDLNPVVFLGMFTGKIAEDLAKQHGLTYPSKGGRRLLEECSMFDFAQPDFFRRLGAAAGEAVEFCTGDHLKLHASDCASYHAELRATTIFTVAVSSAILGFLFFALGKTHMTKLVTYVPTNIMEAFLSCVGYKVFKYALKFCNFEPKQFIPAACIGVPLYFIKALHLGNPAVVIPAMLGFPLAVFYIILFATGGSIESARADGWFFGELENANFYSVWTDSLNIGSGSSGSFAGNINIAAWTKTLADLPIMIIVCLLDCLLKVSSTEAKLPVKADKDYEIQLYGLSNLLTTLCGSSVGYMQLKFNVINFGVMGNVTDRRGGIFYALLCGICFFGVTDLFNYLPRFFLSTLLFFAGSGFVAENLWGSRKYLSIGEWLQIFVVLGVFIFAGSLLAAVIVGALLAGVSFIMRYAKISPIQGHPLKGDEVVSIERKSPLLQSCIRHVSSERLMVVRLKGFVFFASAQNLTGWITKQVEQQQDGHDNVPKYKRIRWIILDCASLDGLDSSASKAVAKLSNAMKEWKVEVLWTGMSDSFFKQLKNCGTISEEEGWFKTLEDAVSFTDDQIAVDIVEVQNRWDSLSPMFALSHKIACDRELADPFSSILRFDDQRFGCPWQYCSRKKIIAYDTVLWTPGDLSHQLYLIHSGQVALFKTIPSSASATSKTEWPKPAAIFSHGWFINRLALVGMPTDNHAIALEDGELIYWTERQWAKMTRENPHMADAIKTMVLQQEARDAAFLEKERASLQDLSSSPEEFGADATGEDQEAKDAGLAVQARRGAGQDLEAQDLKRLMHFLAGACQMDTLGLFDEVPADEEWTLSELPQRVRQDIATAFATFSIPQVSMDDFESEPALVGTSIEDAIRYAGIGSIALQSSTRAIDEAEFLTLCSWAMLAPLSKAKVDWLTENFDQKATVTPGGVKYIERSNLPDFLSTLMNHNFDAAEIDGIANVWCDPADPLKVSIDSLCAVVARLVRSHMDEARVIKGLKKLIGVESLDAGSKITTSALIAANADLSEAVAAEMIWMASHGAVTVSAELDAKSIVGMLNVVVGCPRELPPAPCEVIADSNATESSNDNREWLRSLLFDAKAIEAPEKKAEIVPLGSADIKPMFSADVEEVEVIPDTWQAKLLCLLDRPDSSKTANNVSVFMGIMILVSVLTLFLEPLASPKNKPLSDDEIMAWFTIEAFFTIIFTIEFLLTFAVCNAFGTQTHLQFLKDPMRICDLVAIMPFYIDQTIDADQEEFRLFRIARLMRLSRLVRLGRLAKKSATFAPIAMILVVIWGIYMKNGLKE